MTGVGVAGGLSLAEGWPRALAALLLVLGAALVLAWALRRSGLAKPLAQARLDVVASRQLGGRDRLVLARWDGREHLLAVGPAGVTLVESRDAPAVPVSEGPAPAARLPRTAPGGHAAPASPGAPGHAS